jgi:hypothetical protein
MATSNNIQASDAVSRTIMPRCLYPTGIAMKNNMLLDGNSRIFFEI